MSFSPINVLSFVQQWFDIYYRRLRPVFQRAGRKRKRGEDDKDVEDPKDLFFLSSVGKGVHRTTNDIARLQNKFNVPVVSSKVVRRVFETSTKDMSDSAKTLVSGYFSHSNAVANQHYRYPTPGQRVKGIQILKGMVPLTSSSGDETSSDPSGKGNNCESSGESTGSSNPGRTTRSAVVARSDSDPSFDNLLKKWPVTIDGPKPKRELLQNVEESSWRKAYERWEKMQWNMRQESFRCEYFLSTSYVIFMKNNYKFKVVN